MKKRLLRGRDLNPGILAKYLAVQRLNHSAIETFIKKVNDSLI